MKSAGPLRIMTATAVAIAMVALLGGLAATPAGAAGLALTPTTPTTGLTPGVTVTVRISGATARQVVRYGVCADSVPCAPGTSVTTNASGVATVSIRVTGTATYASGGKTGVKACRPDRCFVAVHPQGQPTAPATLRLLFSGERVTASFAPTVDLADGQTVFVTGRVRGAERRAVRAVQIAPACGAACTTTLGDGVVKADGTFSLAGPVHRTVGSASCTAPAGSTAPGPCLIEVSVVGDPSHGIASTPIRFLVPGLTATVTPRSDLVDRQSVRVTGRQPGLAGRLVRIRQLACDTTDPFHPICSAGAVLAARLDSQGRLATSVPVRRFVGTEDCARNRYPVPDCSIEITAITEAGAVDRRFEATRTIVFFRPA